MKWVAVASFFVCFATLSRGGDPESRHSSNSTSSNSTTSVGERNNSTTSVAERNNSTTSVRERKKERRECLAGSEWDSKCYKCRCSEDGHAECTSVEVCLFEDYGDPIRCKPNTTFMNDCNACTCLESGEFACTMLKCMSELPAFPIPGDLPDGPALLESEGGFVESLTTRGRKDCQPGSRWRSRCNECLCTVDGLAACTEMACPELDNDPVRTCAPDSKWMNDCNNCWCNSGRAVCTRMGCNFPIITDFHPIGVPSSTEEAQIALRSAPNEKNVVCAANRMFIKDCNTCWCNEDGTSYFCTRKVCITDLPDEVIEEQPENQQEQKRKCKPDEVFELDCNMCRCNSDGMGFSCTRRACVPEEKAKNLPINRSVRATAQGPPKNCKPGTEFRMDCNKCLCDNEGQNYSCTRMDCAALNGNGNGATRKKRATAQVQTQCVPESVFNQGCNVCRCEADGNHATCSIKRCKEDNPDEDADDVSPGSDLSFRCNPGEQFKRGCNDCTCSADGKSVFCTIRLCDQDITPAI